MHPHFWQNFTSFVHGVASTSPTECPVLSVFGGTMVSRYGAGDGQQVLNMPCIVVWDVLEGLHHAIYGADAIAVQHFLFNGAIDASSKRRSLAGDKITSIQSSTEVVRFKSHEIHTSL
jgi:hypothetical protein